MKSRLINSPGYYLFSCLRNWIVTQWIFHYRGKAVFPENRRFHGYCVGIAKSGTTSIASLFWDRYRARHEPMSYHFVHMWLKWKKGKVSVEEFSRYLAMRDARLGLEFESSHFLYDKVGMLAELFPRSKFILPVRDLYSWLCSIVNHEFQVRQFHRRSHWIGLLDWYFGREYGEPDEDDAYLLAQGLHPLSVYLEHWRDHYEVVLAAVDRSRLLVVKTEELALKQDEIAEFLGVDLGSSEKSVPYINRREEKEVSIEGISRKRVEEKIEAICGPTILKLIPKNDV